MSCINWIKNYGLAALFIVVIAGNVIVFFGARMLPGPEGVSSEIFLGRIVFRLAEFDVLSTIVFLVLKKWRYAAVVAMLILFMLLVFSMA